MRHFFVAVLFFTLACDQRSSKPAPKSDSAGLTGLADCLTKKGVVFYGASWCGFCKKQERIFGEAFSRIRHVACEDPEGDPNIDPGCLEAGGYCYPTWAFPSGKRRCGVMTPAQLAKESGCPYPDGS